jgi:hypothetical protein
MIVPLSKPVFVSAGRLTKKTYNTAIMEKFKEVRFVLARKDKKRVENL